MSLLDSVQVYENFLEPDNLERIKFDINNAAWSTTGCTDDTEERAIRFLRQDTYEDNFYSVFLLNKIKKRTNKNLDWALQPFPYFNGQAFGQDASIHYDGLGKDEFTFLLYCTEKYEPSMGGFTLFKEGDEEVVVLPKYNRGVFFRGSLLHKAFTFSRVEHPLRVSLAFKLKLI